MIMLATLLLSASGSAQQVQLNGRPLLMVASRLKPGQYVWEPEHSPDGPILILVNLETQRLLLFRDGVPIAAATIAAGKTGHETPTGIFTILHKNEKHFSKTYNNAPMPNMQRLTWGGVALHAGNLPGYPASHGCVRLPLQFSKLLFGQTSVGMTVVITSHPDMPMHQLNLIWSKTILQIGHRWQTPASTGIRSEAPTSMEMRLFRLWSASQTIVQSS